MSMVEENVETVRRIRCAGFVSAGETDIAQARWTTNAGSSLG
jgi:hypothetical protein